MYVTNTRGCRRRNTHMRRRARVNARTHARVCTRIHTSTSTCTNYARADTSSNIHTQTHRHVKAQSMQISTRLVAPHKTIKVLITPTRHCHTPHTRARKRNIIVCTILGSTPVRTNPHPRARTLSIHTKHLLPPSIAISSRQCAVVLLLGPGKGVRTYA